MLPLCFLRYPYSDRTTNILQNQEKSHPTHISHRRFFVFSYIQLKGNILQNYLVFFIIQTNGGHIYKLFTKYSQNKYIIYNINKRELQIIMNQFHHFFKSLDVRKKKYQRRVGQIRDSLAYQNQLTNSVVNADLPNNFDLLANHESVRYCYFIDAFCFHPVVIV